MDSVHVRLRRIPTGLRRFRDECEANVAPGDWTAIEERARKFILDVKGQRLGMWFAVENSRVVVEELFEGTFLGDEWRELVVYRVELLEGKIPEGTVPMRLRELRRRRLPANSGGAA